MSESYKPPHKPPHKPNPSPPSRKRPPVRHILRNDVYPDRVATLFRGELGQFIVGDAFRGLPNQEWILEVTDVAKSQYIISTVATSNGGATAYATNPEVPVPGDALTGEPATATVYTVETYDPNKSYYRITVPGGKGTLAWTLSSDTENSKVYLSYQDPNPGEQVWKFEEVPTQ